MFLTKIKQDQRDQGAGGWAALLNRLVREGEVAEVDICIETSGRLGDRPCGYLGKSSPGRGKGLCKGPEAGRSLLCLETIEEAGAEQAVGRRQGMRAEGTVADLRGPWGPQGGPGLDAE